MRPVLVDPTVGNLGLRERKKLQTRQRIAEVAHDLFATRGFDDVTMADIADGADISVKTVFNYFGNKEDLAFEGEAQVVAVWLGAVRSRPEYVTPLDAVRGLIESQLDDELLTRIEGFAAIVAESTDLQSRLRLLWDHLEEGVARLLAAERSHGPTDDPLELAVARVAAARVVTLARLYFGPEARRFLSEAVDRAAALKVWLDRVTAELSQPGDRGPT